MKILYHHRTASKDGQAVHIVEMIDALRSEGHEVRVVVAWPGGSGRLQQLEVATLRPQKKPAALEGGRL